MPGVILGSRALPSAYDHPHASEPARQIAERGTILRGQVGSGVHGTSISGQDDRDEPRAWPANAFWATSRRRRRR